MDRLAAAQRERQGVLATARRSDREWLFVALLVLALVGIIGVSIEMKAIYDRQSDVIATQDRNADIGLGNRAATCTLEASIVGADHLPALCREPAVLALYDPASVPVAASAARQAYNTKLLCDLLFLQGESHPDCTAVPTSGP